MNQHTKFEVCSFNHSKDTEGVPKFKSRSRDLDHAPLSFYFAFFDLVVNLYTKFEVCIFSHSRDMEGVAKF